MIKSISIPRLVIGGTGSSVGKTTLVLSLAQAFRKRGLRVAVFKCGPDYLDPTYHERVSGRTCHNLDGWMMGREAVLSTFANACEDADIALIEGVMGLFDGASPTSDVGSTAEIAKWLSAPVLLTINAKGMARTIAPIAQGFVQFDPALRIAGVVSNYVGSESHLALLRTALSDPPIVGGFPKSPEQALPERHLGLHSANAVDSALLEYWGALSEQWLRIDQILEIAKSAPALSLGAKAELGAQKNRACRIGIAQDEAFHFYYQYNLQSLRDLGAELVFFSPLHDESLPEMDGLYIGGGYPELHADALAKNEKMKRAIYEFGKSGRPLYAECGGLMYLTDAITTLDKKTYPMVGLVPGTVQMRDKLQALGYVEVATEDNTILGPSGLRFRGHQFRYSDFTPLENASTKLLYSVRKRRGKETSPEGYSQQNILASYVHGHWASNPGIAKAFVEACSQ